MKIMGDKTKRLLFVIVIVVGGVSLGLILNKFFPCRDYMTPLFIVLAIQIYLSDMFEKNKRK